MGVGDALLTSEMTFTSRLHLDKSHDVAIRFRMKWTFILARLGTYPRPDQDKTLPPNAQ
jgi:hypothetical protein